MVAPMVHTRLLTDFQMSLVATFRDARHKAEMPGIRHKTEHSVPRCGVAHARHSQQRAEILHFQIARKKIEKGISIHAC